MLAADVRFGSKADIGARLDHVRFTPESGDRVRRNPPRLVFGELGF